MSYTDVYYTKLGDMWDFISFLVYGSDRYVNELMLANPTRMSTVIFEAGARLVIPDIAIANSTPLPAWKSAF